MVHCHSSSCRCLCSCLTEKRCKALRVLFCCCVSAGNDLTDSAAEAICDMLKVSRRIYAIFSAVYVPLHCPTGRHGLTLTWWGCCCLFLCHKPTELAHSILFCSCVRFCLYGPFNCISSHKFSQQLSALSLCSSDLISARLVLSTIYLFMEVSLSPDIILCG